MDKKRITTDNKNETVDHYVCTVNTSVYIQYILIHDMQQWI